MKRSKIQRCNHCGGAMRKYMDGAPTCLSCGRYENHVCKQCVSTSSVSKGPGKKRKALAA